MEARKQVLYERFHDAKSSSKNCFVQIVNFNVVTILILQFHYETRKDIPSVQIWALTNAGTSPVFRAQKVAPERSPST